MAWWRDLGRFYPPSVPRRAKGGIRAQSKRGTFGESWWARRWIEVLEHFDIGARLNRGRSYARRGQVLSITINTGVVEARVQGSRPTPYQVRIEVKTLSAQDWKRLAESLGRQALVSAKLFAGEMPRDIEEAFTSVGLSLFPSEHKDLTTECSCPDWSNPCKHIAAVYSLLGEEFDRDPFLIFRLRGMEREGLLGLLAGPAEGPRKGGRRKAHRAATGSEADPPPALEPLPADPMSFWVTSGTQVEIGGEVRVPSVDAALPKRLGNFPFWRGEEHLMDVLEGIYCEASSAGMEVFLGESSRRGED